MYDSITFYINGKEKHFKIGNFYHNKKIAKIKPDLDIAYPSFTFYDENNDIIAIFEGFSYIANYSSNKI